MRPWVPSTLLLAALAGCKPRGRTETTAPAPAPSSALPATSATRTKGDCPLSIVPGRSLGPVHLGDRVEALATVTGLPVRVTSRAGTTEFLEVGALKVRACRGVVSEIWLEDVRTAPPCVEVPGSFLPAVQPSVARSEFTRRFGKCTKLPPRKGGTFDECADGGVRVGTGLGNFIQVRVAAAGSSLDDTCDPAVDDGGVRDLAPDELTQVLQRTLELDALVPYWHRELPGRVPLRVARTDANRAVTRLTMFGSPVIWLEAEHIKAGRPIFEFTAIEATVAKVTVQFRFAAEGVVGKAVFEKRGREWLVVEKSVAER